MAATLQHGDCRFLLGELSEESVDLAVTSIPFWGLRAYGTEPQVWGTGDATWKGELGGEPTPGEFVEHVREVFRSVYRVLAPHGLLFLNVGDSFSGSGRGRNADGSGAPGSPKQQTNRGTREGTLMPAGEVAGCADGEEIGIPWSVAFALREDGWRLRKSVTLIKKNPMPFSGLGVRWQECRVRVDKSPRAAEGSKHALSQVAFGKPHGARDGRDFDSEADWLPCPGCDKCLPNGGLVLCWHAGRPTSATEMLFIFSKSDRFYWDTEAVRRPVNPSGNRKGCQPYTANGSASHGVGSPSLGHDTGRGGNSLDWLSTYAEAMDPAPADGEPRDWLLWEPEPSSLAHYAAFGTFIPAYAVKAGTPEGGCCASCGAPFARVIRRGDPDLARQQACGGDANGAYHGQATKDFAAGGAQNASDAKRSILRGMRERRTDGWKATCRCANPAARPAVVLDPFSGSGTTVLAADRLGRDGIGFDLNAEYVRMSEERIRSDAPLFAELTSSPAPAPCAQPALLFGEESA